MQESFFCHFCNMEKLYRYFIIGIIIVLAIVQTTYLYIHSYDYRSEIVRVNKNYTLTQQELDLLEDGDILLRHGYGFVSDIIANTLKEHYSLSHCAILVKTDSIQKVIHSVSQSLSDDDGVQTQSLKRFISDSKYNSLIVLRYKNKQEENRSDISKWALHYLDKKVPFDNAFDIKDTSEFFCTELIWKVFLNAFSVDIFEKKYNTSNLEFLKFDVFFNEDYFETILNHHEIKE